jgi:signal peptidase I
VKTDECKKRVGSDYILWDIAMELLNNRNMVKFQAPGVSMSPFIWHNEMITVKPCSHEDLTFGDIILYYGFGNQSRQLSIPLEDKKIVHRFLWRREIGGESRLITKGDNNYLCDPPVSPHQVLGKVVKIEKNGWKLRLDSTLGRLLNTLCGLAIIPPVSFFSYPCMKKAKWVFHRIRNE